MLPGNQQRQHVVALPAYLQTDLDPGRLGGWKENLVVEKMFMRLRLLRVTAVTAAEEGLEDVAEAAAAFVRVRVRRGVSSHGLALNVSTDLSWFDAIVPCGIPGADVTSLARLRGAPPAHERVEQAFAEAFEQVFDLELAPGEQAAGEAPASAARERATIDGR